MQRHVRSQTAFAVQTSGTTATVAVLMGWELLVANVGDSLAFLDSGSEVVQARAPPLPPPHPPNLPGFVLSAAVSHNVRACCFIHTLNKGVMWVPPRRIRLLSNRPHDPSLSGTERNAALAEL